MSRTSLNAFLCGLAFVFLSSCQQAYQLRFKAMETESRRTLEVAAATNEFKPVVKVVLIVDNSMSMKDEQLALSQGISRMADSLRDFNVDFFLYTTSALDPATSAQKGTHVAQTEFLFSNETGQPAVTSSSPAVSLKLPAYTQRTVNRLSGGVALLGSPGLNFRAGISQSEFEVLRESLTQTVKSIGIEGSNEEAGLCALGRVLLEDESNPVFKSGDKAAFVIISDTDDWSILDSCTREVQRQAFKYSETAMPPAELEERASGAADTQWYAYQASFEGTPGAGTPAIYRLKYDYLISKAFKVTSKYTDPKFTLNLTYHNAAPIYRVHASYYAPVFKVSYQYKYDSTCIVDEQPEPCVLSGGASGVGFDPIEAGNPPTASGACPAGLQSYVKSRLLTAGQTLASCTYTYSAATSQSSEAFNPADYGNPPAGSGNLACTPSLSAKADSMVPAGKLLSSCHYTYTEALASLAKVFLPAEHGNPPTGSGNLACTPSLIAYAQSLVPEGKTYKSCTYSYSNPQKSIIQDFTPAQYGNPPEGSGNLSCNAELESLARSLVPTGLPYAGCSYAVMLQVGSGQKDFLPGDYGIPVGGSGNMACNAALKAYAQSLINSAAPGKEVRSCYYNFIPPVAGTPAPVFNCSYRDLPANKELNLCDGSAFINGSQSFGGLEAYFRAVPASCATSSLVGKTFKGCTSRTGWKRTVTSFPPIGNYVPVGTATHLAVHEALLPGATSLEEGILARASSLFGANGFLLSAIIHDDDLPTAGCDSGYRAAAGKRYRALVNRVGGNGYIQPICSHDYSPSLNNLREFIVRTAIGTYQLPLGANEYVEGVGIRRGSHLIEMQLGTDFTVQGGNVDFVPDRVQPGDTVVFTIVEKFLAIPTAP